MTRGSDVARDDGTTLSIIQLYGRLHRGEKEHAPRRGGAIGRHFGSR